MRKKKTRKAFEQYLNTVDMAEKSFIMRGKMRWLYFARHRYGSCLRKYDKVQFEVGFSEWRQNG